MEGWVRELHTSSPVHHSAMPARDTSPSPRQVLCILGLLVITFAVCTASAAAPYPAAPGNVQPFVVEHSGARLAGDLVLPCTKGPHPLVVVLHAASSPTRDLALYEHLKRVLPPLGLAVLTYDRRGSGESTQGHADGGYAALADDAIAAARQLASDPRIDQRRIGFWGLSQGGWLSVLALQRWPEAAFAISVSAPMVTPDAQMLFAVNNVLRIKGFPADQVAQALALRRQVDGYMRGDLPFAAVKAAVDAARGEPWFADAWIGRLEPRATASWAREMTHDPLRTLAATSQPLLVIYGKEDPWIPVADSVARLRGLGSARPGLSIYVVPDADHAMMYSHTPAQQVDTAFFSGQRPEAPDYFAVLGTWLGEQGLVSRVRDPSCASPLN